MTEMNMRLAVAEVIVPYLHPVTFMHFIESSKYLYEKHQSKIPAKRKESLMRFMNDKPVERIGDWIYSRYTKLPNGRIEGKYETISDMHYSVFNYFDGKRVEDYLVYNHRRYKSKYIAGEDTLSLERILVSQFGNWEDIDVSKMQLLPKENADDSTDSSGEN